MRVLSLAVLLSACLQAAPPTCNAGWPSYAIQLLDVPYQGYIGNTYRAGFTATLNGTASAAGDGTSITKYVWQELPDTVNGSLMQAGDTWSSHTGATPTVKGLRAGTWDIQLTVTQGNGQTASCVIYNGVVSTDSNGTTILASDSLGNMIQQFISNPVQYQKNPWPMADEANHDSLINVAKTYDLERKGTPSYYTKVVSGTPDFAQNGTVTLTNSGSGMLATFSGQTTNPDVLFCGGAGNTTPTYNNYFILWYKTGRTNSDGSAETGRMSFQDGGSLNSCTASTLTLGYHDSAAEYTGATKNWPPGITGWAGMSDMMAPIASQTGLSWSYTTPSGCTVNAFACYYSFTAPYYDLPLAFYSWYYRSGFDPAWRWARKMADYIWTSPGLDRGNALADALFHPCVNNVACWNTDTKGLFLRAYDNTDLSLSMWPGLHHLYLWAADYLTQHNSDWYAAQGASRLVGGAYMMLGIAGAWDNSSSQYATTYCPNCATEFNIGTVSWGQFARNALHWALNRPSCSVNCNPTGNQAFYKWQDPVTKGFLTFYEGRSSYDSGQTYTGVFASATNGSTSVTCTGCSWAATDFSNLFDQNNGGASCGAQGGTCTHAPITFCNSTYAGSGTTVGNVSGRNVTGLAYDTGQCDNTSYCELGGCSFTGSTLTLDRAYTGTTGTKHWILGTNPAGSASGIVTGDGFVTASWAADSFLMGLMGHGFYQAYLACTSAANGCDSNDANQALTWSQDIAKWHKNYAYNSTWYGMAYIGGSTSCIKGQSAPVTIPVAEIVCNIGQGNVAAREIFNDGASAINMINYWQKTSDASMKTILDNWYAGMWDNGTGSPPVLTPDATYDFQFWRDSCTISSTYPYFSCGGTSCFGSSCNFWNDRPGTGGANPFLHQKEIAQAFGLGNAARWPSDRIGGPVAVNNITVSFSARIADIPNAAKYRVVIFPPTADTADTTCGTSSCVIVCNSSPCSTTLDASRGNWNYQIQFMNVSSVIIAKGDIAQLLNVVTVN